MQFSSSAWYDGHIYMDGEESDEHVYSGNRVRGGDPGVNAFVDRVNPD